MLKVVLFEPEIAGNVGSIIRSCVCFNSELHIIEPCGFPFDIKRIKKSALDYIDNISIYRHSCFANFVDYKNQQHPQSRIIVASTKSSQNLFDFKFTAEDFVIFGKESSGLPEYIHQIADARLRIEMLNNQRSLNLAVSSAIFLAKANNDFAK